MNDDVDLSPEELTEGYLAFREKAQGTNISPQTLLATDYLNHFNEIVMLLEMIPDMPELLEEAREWQPKSYPDFVRASTFSEAELAADAYEHVPARFKAPFEKTIGQLDHLITSSIDRLEADLQGGNLDLLRENAKALSRVIQKLMDHASGIMHGGISVMDQGEIDAMIG